MELVRCNRGHFYDPEEYSSCPKCQKEKNSGVGTILETSYFDDGAHSSASASAHNSDVIKTEYLGAPDQSNNKGDPCTVAADSQDSKVQTYGATVPADTIKTTKSGVESIHATTPVFYTSYDFSMDQKEKMPVNPVVGWLVCIEGPTKGKDYRVVGQNNYIGRNKNMEISVPEDTAISADRSAVISYDNRHRTFYFGLVNGHNNVYVNDKPVFNAEPIKAYDVLEVGNSKFIFVPLCGERFDWNA